ncbi:MAG: kelch repeat-containing protein [Chthoniobacteraceae bacterium]
MKLLLSLLLCTTAVIAQTEPTFRDISYGPHERHKLDVWQARSDAPTPLVIFIHGGGWHGGDKADVPAKLVGFMLARGVSVASINYRYTSIAILPAPVHDAARAVQYLRSKAAEWKLDPKRFAAYGISAGATSTLWLAYHDDLADPRSADPVARESSRLQAAVGMSPQTSLEPEVVVGWAGAQVLNHPMIARAVGAKKLDEMKSPSAAWTALLREFSPINHVSHDDPPVLISNPKFDPLPAANAGSAIHHAIFGTKLKEKADAARVPCVLRIEDQKDKAAPTPEEFLIKHLLSATEARQRAREAAVQSAGIDRALSKDMPEQVKALPIFGGIDWTVKELPFVTKGPHAGISGAGMVVVDGQIYLAGGFIPAGDGTQDASYRTSRWAHRYDPKTGEWTQLPDLPARREYTRAIATNDAVFVLGGFIQGRPGLPAADVFRLDVNQPPPQWTTVAPLTVPRTHMAVGKVGSKLVVAGGNKYDVAEKGYSPNTIQGVTDIFDLTKPEQGWEQRATIPGSPRGWSASAVVGEKFYMLGGVTWTAKARVRLAETLSYDPARDEWKRLADFPMPISGWEADTFADRYLIAIGGAGTRWNDVPFVYDSKTDRWMRIEGPLPPGALFNDPGVCIVGDTIYVAGGEGSGGSHFNHFLIGRIRPRQ